MAPGRPKPLTALQAALVLSDQPFAKLTPLGRQRGHRASGVSSHRFYEAPCDEGCAAALERAGGG